MPTTLRNPLYHWSHLELKRYFGIDTLLNESTAPEIWEQANARLRDDDRDVHGILKDFQVEVICTSALDFNESGPTSSIPSPITPAIASRKIPVPEAHLSLRA